MKVEPPYIPRVIEAIDEEESQVVSERDAFERFRKQTARLDTSAERATATSHRQTVVQSARTDSGLRDVAETYRETVMGVAHYDDVYGDTLTESMASEFGDSVAVAVATADGLTPDLRQTILDAAEQAITSREEYLDVLNTEKEYLTDVRERLAKDLTLLENIDVSSLPPCALSDEWRRLERLLDRYDRIAGKRQRHLNDTLDPTIAGGRDLCEYLCETLPVDYPVLAAVAEIVARIETMQDRIVERFVRVS